MFCGLVLMFRRCLPSRFISSAVRRYNFILDTFWTRWHRGLCRHLHVLRAIETQRRAKGERFSHDWCETRLSVESYWERKLGWFDQVYPFHFFLLKISSWSFETVLNDAWMWGMRGKFICSGNTDGRSPSYDLIDETTGLNQTLSFSVMNSVISGCVSMGACIV